MSLDHVPTPELLDIREKMQFALNDLNAQLTTLKNAISATPAPENPLTVLIYAACCAKAEEGEFIQHELQTRLDMVDCEIISRLS